MGRILDLFNDGWLEALEFVVVSENEALSIEFSRLEFLLRVEILLEGFQVGVDDVVRGVGSQE